MNVKELLENKPRLHELPKRYDQLFKALKEAVEVLEKIADKTFQSPSMTKEALSISLAQAFLSEQEVK